MEKIAKLVLSDGKVFVGKAFGKMPDDGKPVVAEVVFNTSMYGYQEILSDPSYKEQMLCFTSPHIGNVGCNLDDNESDGAKVSAVIVKDYRPLYSNYRATMSLEEYMNDYSIPGIANIDTRELVRHLRDNGSKMGAIAFGDGFTDKELQDFAVNAPSMEGRDLVKEVTCKEPYDWYELPFNLKKNAFESLSEREVSERPLVVVLDCGVKRNILRLLLESGFRVKVVPASTTANEILELNPRALFISNGPGDPGVLNSIVEEVKELVYKIPIFGICLGHQILCQAIGGKTYKMKFGHRGGNHPVKGDLVSKIEITVQNHGFAVDAGSINGGCKVSHINLNDKTVEGLELKDNAGFSIQYHPEASPGPVDSQYLFSKFFKNVEVFYA